MQRFGWIRFALFPICANNITQNGDINDIKLITDVYELNK